MKKMHTSGPWYAICGYKILTVSNRKTSCIHAVTIAEVVNPCDQSYIANAKLIAAAPEMLESLHNLINAASGDTIENLKIALADAKAIIKKATE